MDKKAQQFIALRAEGLSYDNIAKELKVSKSTLIQWGKYYEDEIKELQFLAMIEIKRVYSHNVRTKYEMLIKQLDKIDNAIIEADISKESLKDLMLVKNSLLQQLNIIETGTATNSYLKDNTQLFNKEIKAKLSDYD